MGPALRQSAVIDNNDAIGISQSGEAVRNGKGGAIVGHFVNGILNQLFGFGIQCRGCLIQNQNRRIMYQCARNGNALPLTARKRIAFFANKRIVPFRQSHDKIMRICRTCRRYDLFIACMRVGVSNIFQHRTGKQVRFLQNHTHLRTKRVLRHFLQIDAVNGDTSAPGIVHTHNQINQCTFPASRMPDNTNHLACFHRKRYIPQNRSAAFVSEGNMLNADIAANPNVGRLSNIGNLRFFLQNFHNLAKRGHKVGNVTRNGGDFHQRRVNNAGIDIKLVQCTYIHGTVKQAQIAVHQNHVTAEMQCKSEDGKHGIKQLCVGFVLLCLRIGTGAKFVNRVLLLSIGLDNANAAQTVLQCHVGILPHFPCAAIAEVHFLTETVNDKDDKRHRDKNEQAHDRTHN